MKSETTRNKPKEEQAVRRPALLFLFLVSGFLFLVSSGGAAEETGPVFVVHTAEGAQVRGALKELGADWSVRLSGDKETRTEGAEVLAMRRAGRPLPAFPSGKQFILANGDRFPVEGPRLVGERLFFRHPAVAGGKEAELPLAALSVLWLASPDNEDNPERLRRQLAAGPRMRDLVLLRNSDVLEGVLNALDDKKVEVEADKKKVDVELAKVAAVALSTQLADTLRPKGTYARLTLTGDGDAPSGRLSLASASCADGKTVRGKTLFGAEIAVPLNRVAALDLYQGRAVYLSDLKPARYEYVPFFNETFGLALDGNVKGLDLRLGGSTYDKGLGMHGKSRVTYSLGGAYRRFEAVVGLDDEIGRGGQARVRVVADGKALTLTGDRELTGGGEPLAVGVNVARVKELTLEVDYGARGHHVKACVNWADARLIR
jgi:hypothetical protein